MVSTRVARTADLIANSTADLNADCNLIACSMACVDDVLDPSWISAGPWTCSMGLSDTDFCEYEEFDQKYCHCGCVRGPSETVCSDRPLPGSWVSGGAFTCNTWKTFCGPAYCAEEAIDKKCCHCRGGNTKTTTGPCEDIALTSEWSSGVDWTYAALSDLDDVVRCDNEEIAETCRHCHASTDFLSSCSVHGHHSGRQGRDM